MPPKAEDRRDEGDDKEHERVVQHDHPFTVGGRAAATTVRKASRVPAGSAGKRPKLAAVFFWDRR